MLKITKVVVVLALLTGNVAEAGCFGGGRGLFGAGRCGGGLFARFRHHGAAGYGYRSYGYSYQSYQSYGGCGSMGYGYGAQQACAVPSAQYYMPTPQSYPTPAPQSYPPVPRKTSATTPAQTQQVVQGDPYGFLALLNAQRARMGLSPVAFGYDVYADACENNRQQRFRGMGHFFMGRARRQNAGMGQTSVQQILYAWMGSPGHAAALFDPTIRVAAVAHEGGAWTFSAY